MSQDLSIRLQQWEAAPPAESWSNIAACLASTEYADSLGPRLHALEIQPPAGTWSTIEEQMHPVPVRRLPLPHHHTIPLYVRPFWVAAAMIVFFVGGMWYYQVSPFQPSPLSQKSFSLSSQLPQTNSTEYIPYQSPGGQPIRISKRLQEVFLPSAASNKSNSKKAITDAQLEQWRKQIRASNFIPSQDNFMSILEMQEMLSEK